MNSVPWLIDPDLRALFATPAFRPNARHAMPVEDFMFLTIERMRDLARGKFLGNSMWLGEPDEGRFAEQVHNMAWSSALDVSLVTALVDHQIAGNALLRHGDDTQVARFREEIDSVSEVYCFGATEVGGGSDLKNIQTVAVYDPDEKMFVFNSPTPEASKCWIGNSQYSGTVLMVLAKLIVDGNNEGHHWFRVPLRAQERGAPYRGIAVAGAEPKGGVIGNQTGVITFTDHRVPLDALMSRWARIDNDGTYISSIPTQQRFIACLSTFIQERIYPAAGSAYGLAVATTICLRYATHRQTFGKRLLDRPHYQYRLMSIVARAVGAQRSVETLITMARRLFTDSLADQVALHRITSTFKAIASWDAERLAQQLRELCGGHGYHRDNQIVSLRQDADMILTAGGDNTILCYEAARPDADLVTLEEQAQSAYETACSQAPDTVEGALAYLYSGERSALVEAARNPRSQSSVRYTRALYDLTVAQGWVETAQTDVERTLCRLFLMDALTENLHGQVRANLMDAKRAQAVEDERVRLVSECATRPDELLALLAVPEELVEAPIAFPDYARRTITLAQSLRGPE